MELYVFREIGTKLKKEVLSVASVSHLKNHHFSNIGHNGKLWSEKGYMTITNLLLNVFYIKIIKILRWITTIITPFN